MKFKFILKLSIVFLNVSPLIAQNEIIDSLRNQFAMEKTDSGKFEQSIHLSHNFLQFDLDSSQKYIDQAERRITFLSVKTAKPRVYYYQSLILKERGQFNESDSILREALKITDGESAFKSAIFKQLADLNKKLGNYDEAIKFNLNSLEIDNKVKNNDGKIASYYSLGEIYQLIPNDLDLSIKYLDSALFYINATQPIVVQPEVFNLLGKAYYEKKDLQLALEYFHQSLNAYAAQGNIAEEGRLSGNLGMVFLNLGDNKKALYFLKRSLVARESFGEPSDLIESYSNLGGYHFKNNEFELSADYYNNAIEIAKVNDIQNRVLVDLYKALSLSYEYLGDFTEALFYHKEASSMELEALSEASNKEITRLRNNYERSNREREQLKLKEKELEQAAVIENQNFEKAVIGALLFFLLIVSALIFMNYRRRQFIRSKEIQWLNQKKQADSLYQLMKGQEEERKRIAVDLHDGLGGMLTSVKMHFSALIEEFPKTAKLTTFIKTQSLLEEANHEVKKISQNMMPLALKKSGLIKGVSDYSQSVESNLGIKMTLSFDGFNQDERFEETLEIMVFRIIQELIQNTIKHSNSPEVHIILEKTKRNLILEYKDFGIGFDPSDAGYETHGIGLKNIRSRVEFLRGEQIINTMPGMGLEMQLKFPLTP